MKRKKMWAGTAILLAVLCLSGCKKSVESTESSQTQETQGEADQGSGFQSTSGRQTPEIGNVMDRIIEEQGLDNAVDYESKADDLSKDTVVRLCRSESGKYTAYGFISPEYGKKGILIDNIINDESNWNYFWDYAWSYGSTAPTLQEQGEYDVIFSFTKEDGKVQELYFETYDTGTMSVRE